MSKRFALGDSTWQRWELEGRLPNHKVLEALKDLGLDLNWLTSGEGTAPPIDGTYRARLVESLGGAVLGYAPETAAGGLSGEPYRHQPGPPVPVEPPPPPAAPIPNADLLVEIYRKLLWLYANEQISTTVEELIQSAVDVYNDVVAASPPQGPFEAAVEAQIRSRRGWLRKHRDEILRGPRGT